MGMLKILYERLKRSFYRKKRSTIANIAEAWLLTRIAYYVLLEFFILLLFGCIYWSIITVLFIIDFPRRFTRWVVFGTVGLVYRISDFIFDWVMGAHKKIKGVYFKRKDYPEAYRKGGGEDIKRYLLSDYEFIKNRLHLIFYVNTFRANLLGLYRGTIQKFLVYFIWPDKFYRLDLVKDWGAIKAHLKGYLTSFLRWNIFFFFFVYCILLGGRMGMYFPNLFWQRASPVARWPHKWSNWPIQNPFYWIDSLEIFEYSMKWVFWYIPHLTGYLIWKDSIGGVLGYVRARTMFDWFSSYIPYFTQMYYTTPPVVKAKPTDAVEPPWLHMDFWSAAEAHLGRISRYRWLTRRRADTYEKFVDYILQKLWLPVELKEYLKKFFYLVTKLFDGVVWYMHELPLNLVVPYVIPYLNDVDWLAYWYLDVYRPILYYFGLFFFLWYIMCDYIGLVFEQILKIAFNLFVYGTIGYLICTWIYIICVFLYEIFVALLKHVMMFIVSFFVLIRYGPKAWYKVYVPLTKFRLAYKKKMLQLYWRTWYHPTLLGLVYIFEVSIPGNKGIDTFPLDELQAYQCTIDKYLYKLVVEDHEDDEPDNDDADAMDDWFENERLFRHVITATTAGYNNLMFYLFLPVIIGFPYISTFLAKVCGWFFYFDRFAETEFERARESISFTVITDFWAENELMVIPKVSMQYFVYKHHFKYITWYFNYLQWDYNETKQYEIYTHIIELVDELVWECGMPCIIASFVCLILYHYVEEFGDYFYIEDLFDFMMVYFCVLADEAFDLSVFWNNISTLMLDTQCNVDYIGFYGLKPQKEYASSGFWLRERMRKTLYNEYYPKRRLTRFIAYWQPGPWNHNLKPIKGVVTQYDRYWFRQSKYELEKRRNRPNDPIWEDNNYDYYQKLRTLNKKKYLERKNKEKKNQ